MWSNGWNLEVTPINKDLLRVPHSRTRKPHLARVGPCAAGGPLTPTLEDAGAHFHSAISKRSANPAPPAGRNPHSEICNPKLNVFLRPDAVTSRTSSRRVPPEARHQGVHHLPRTFLKGDCGNLVPRGFRAVDEDEFCTRFMGQRRD